MFELRNKTPFRAAIFPGLDKHGVEHVSVLVKATYALPAAPARAGAPLTVADQQVPLHMADVLVGDDPATSSVKYQSDVGPLKPGTDVVLVGKAYPERGRSVAVEVSLEVGPLAKRARVSGDRAWTRAGSWIVSSPIPFEEMPLCYERAFGGWDRSHPDPRQHGGDDRNPVGTGFAASQRAERLEGLRLPNIEDPAKAIDDPRARPPVVGFGFVGRGWLPRRALAGTYDAAWDEQRAPLLPLDFDERFFNGAPADLVATPRLRGGESVRVRGASRAGPLAFALPAPEITVGLSVRRELSTTRAELDTVIIEPDDARVVLSFRATVPCPRRLIHVEAASVTWR